MRFRALGWVIISAMAATSLDGVLCGSHPQADPAMECCRQDANRFDASEMEDCCRPDRGENVPAESFATNRSKMELEHVAPVAPPVAKFSFLDERRQTLMPLARGLPDVHPHPSRAVPLLI